MNTDENSHKSANTDLSILTYGNKTLRKKAIEVTRITEDLVRLSETMLETMYNSAGIGLAAPQVGKSIRLIVVDVSGEEEPKNPYVFFNPVLVSKEGMAVSEEGCLSVPGIWAEVTRPETITVEALDQKGNPVLLQHIGGLLARCIQHEIDHLDGILFVDKISATERLLNEPKLKKLSKESKSTPA